MKKKKILIGLLLILALMVALLAMLFPGVVQCFIAGGHWTRLPDSCVDLCNPQKGCAEVLTFGCDCGPDKCWNGIFCEANKS